MGAVPDRDELHRLVDQMNPGQLRRLLRLAQSDPGIAAGGEEGQDEAGPQAYAPRARPVIRRLPPMAEPGPGGDALRLFQSFAGVIDSGRGDLSERHEELIREGLTRDGHPASRPA